MPTPQQGAHPTLEDYNNTTPKAGFWSNRRRFMNSLLKAWWPDVDLEKSYHYLPKLDGRDHSHIGIYKYMGEGAIKGLICWADNPAVSGPSASAKRKYQGKLDWLVAVDIFENETAGFWDEGVYDRSEIGTEVFLLPATAAYERAGSKTNSGRWIQWAEKAQDPPGEAKSDLWIADQLFKAVRNEYAQGGQFPDPIMKMNWDYGEEADADKVAMEINGYNIADGSLVKGFLDLQEDGSTACGSWIYVGYFADVDDPATKRKIREKEGMGSNLDYSWAWPANRRIVYNRCSADPQGKPWNPELPLFEWNEDTEVWDRYDIPDFNINLLPEDSAKIPFIMLPEGQGRLFANGHGGVAATNDSPLTIHYEPAESPVSNYLYPKATYNPVSQRWYEDHTVETDEERERYPYVMTTYRVSEHYQSGIMTRNMPWLNEAMPELFVELSEELAGELGITNGAEVILESKRLYQEGEQKNIRAKACVTKRFKPMTINGKLVHIVGMPYHWGFKGMSKGAVCNDLAPSVGDANASIPEYKAFLCNVRRAE